MASSPSDRHVSVLSTDPPRSTPAMRRKRLLLHRLFVRITPILAQTSDTIAPMANSIYNASYPSSFHRHCQHTPLNSYRTTQPTSNNIPQRPHPPHYLTVGSSFSDSHPAG